LNDNTSMVNNIRKEKYDHLINLPDNHSLYKCNHCRYIFNINQTGMTNILVILSSNWVAFCPICKRNDSELLCKVFAYSIWQKIKGKKCRTGEIIAGTEICPICNKPICPSCHNHSVVSLSRVTGYVSDTGGWNKAKKQELLDRQHYNI
jgi:hypothetical protein